MHSEALDEVQTTKTESKSISVKEEKIADNGDCSMQDNVKSLIPNLGFSGMFSNCTINISLSQNKYFLEVTRTLIYMHMSLIYSRCVNIHMFLMN